MHSLVALSDGPHIVSDSSLHPVSATRISFLVTCLLGYPQHHQFHPSSYSSEQYLDDQARTELLLHALPFLYFLKEMGNIKGQYTS